MITPEGCASILWGESDMAAISERASQVAEMMKVTADALKELGIVDTIIPEPLGGAHRNHQLAAENLRTALIATFGELSDKSVEQLIEDRYAKFRSIGKYSE